MPCSEGGQVQHVLLFLARWRQAGEILGLDNHVAGRSGHLTLARSFERLTGILRNIEQPFPGCGADFLDMISVGRDEANEGQAAFPS